MSLWQTGEGGPLSLSDVPLHALRFFSFSGHFCLFSFHCFLLFFAFPSDLLCTLFAVVRKWSHSAMRFIRVKHCSKCFMSMNDQAWVLFSGLSAAPPCPSNFVRFKVLIVGLFAAPTKTFTSCEDFASSWGGRGSTLNFCFWYCCLEARFYSLSCTVGFKQTKIFLFFLSLWTELSSAALTVTTLTCRKKEKGTDHRSGFSSVTAQSKISLNILEGITTAPICCSNHFSFSQKMVSSQQCLPAHRAGFTATGV